ncbi:MAG: DUF3990 domain-containing protein [Oscillospiraceae bacterium]|jgi:hypothetical protein|nr:DUF3990 domain-containing protein [Oscillospiraceae bacterium]
MDLPSEKIAIEKDGRCYMCTLKLSTVRGGHHVLYVSDDGLIVKKEPLHRYKERIKRRNNASSRHNVIYQDEINESKPVYNKKPSKNSFRLFHGNPNPDFVPIYGAGRDYHDYGNAFYCTEDYSGAAEWACLRKNISASYVYEYQLQIPSEILSEVRILDFDNLDPIYWLSALLQHRVNNDEGYIGELRDRSIALTDIYPTNCENYDIIYGWRADDRHFAIVRDFLST